MPGPSPFKTGESLDLEIKHILLVDDDRDLTEALRLLLEAKDYVVSTAKNGAEALKLIINQNFDCVVCDMMMPHMPGNMFYLAVQKTKPLLCRRFLFITGHADNKGVGDFLRKVDGYVLYKPVLTEELVKGIEMVIKRTKDDAWD